MRSVWIKPDMDKDILACSDFSSITALEKSLNTEQPETPEGQRTLHALSIGPPVSAKIGLFCSVLCITAGLGLSITSIVAFASLISLSLTLTITFAVIGVMLIISGIMLLFLCRVSSTPRDSTYMDEPDTPSPSDDTAEPKNTVTSEKPALTDDITEQKNADNADVSTDDTILSEGTDHSDMPESTDTTAARLLLASVQQLLDSIRGQSIKALHSLRMMLNHAILLTDMEIHGETKHHCFLIHMPTLQRIVETCHLSAQSKNLALLSQQLTILESTLDTIRQAWGFKANI